MTNDGFQESERARERERDRERERERERETETERDRERERERDRQTDRQTECFYCALLTPLKSVDILQIKARAIYFPTIVIPLVCTRLGLLVLRLKDRDFVSARLDTASTIPRSKRMHARKLSHISVLVHRLEMKRTETYRRSFL